MIDRSRRRSDYVLLTIAGVLTLFGLVMVYSASFVEAFRLYDNPFYYLTRQSIGAMIGIAGLLITQRIHYLQWQRWSVWMMGFAIFLLFLVLVLPASMTEVNGSRSWIRFGSGGPLGVISFQPSEFAKLAMIIYFAHWLSRRSEHVGNVTRGLIPFASTLGVICALVMLEPDMGTTLVIVVIAGAIYFAAGANLMHMVGAAGVGVFAFWMLISISGRNMRIEAFRDPWQYYDTFGYQPIHALYALGSGGWFGTGIGQGIQKFQWLPQAHTDTILAIIGEELGLIGTIFVVAAFLLIAVRGFRIAAHAPDPFAALVAVGITSWLIFQAAINIAVTTSLIPFTGLTLPFLSYGNTSLMMSLVSIGILLNISRHTIVRDREEIIDGVSRQRPPANAILAALAVWRRDGRARLPRFGGRRGAPHASPAARRRWSR